MPERKKKLLAKVCLNGAELFDAVQKMAWLKARPKSKRLQEIMKRKSADLVTRIELITKGPPQLRNMEALVEFYETMPPSDGKSAG